MVWFVQIKTGKMKEELVTGITGQGGSYLADLLIDKGYGK